MIVKDLRIANFRAINEASFSFQPGFNLIVGVNGVGKTSVMHALGVCLSTVLKVANGLPGRVGKFSLEDIRIGANAVTVECDVEITGTSYTYLAHRPRDTGTPQEPKIESREQIPRFPEIYGFRGVEPPRGDVAPATGRALAVFFSTTRAVPSERSPKRTAAAGGLAGACADALASRELRLAEIAAWMKVQEKMRSERPTAGRVLDAMTSAVERFLPDYGTLRLGTEGESLLLIGLGAIEVPVKHLSDGERGALALVLDLTRRLAQANPELDDPALQAEAVVLIDEIDLHLHPRWQRRIARNLTDAFPQCQFIATTHSPQVIGEVEHNRIQIISDGIVYSPKYSFGVDSSRILEEIMGANPRTEEVDALLSSISTLIGEERFDEVQPSLEQLTALLGETDPEVIRLVTILDFLDAR